MKRREKFIPGIYNYCDRWCERCAYTDRCRVCTMTERSAERRRRRGEDPYSMDAALAEVGRNFEKAFRMLARTAKKEGWDLDELAKPTPEIEAAERAVERDVRKDPLVRESWRYMKGAAALLERLGEDFEDGAESAERRAEFMDVDDEVADLAAVREAIEVVSWDHMLIVAKVRRAIRGQREAADEEEEFGEGYLDDAVGSAFVAQRCLQRSQKALTTIYEWHDRADDEIIDLLAQAERIRRGLIARLPGCVDFVWPPPGGEAPAIEPAEGTPQ
jgi:hypothetical protein